MGEIAASLADHVVVTSDNPRSEDPKTIIDADRRTASTAKRYVDRRSARRHRPRHRRRGADDVIVIAGKGHETYQVIGDRVVHFDDREEAELALKKRYKNSVKLS